MNLQRLSSKEFNARPAPDMPISSNMRKAFGMSRPRGRIVVELICGQGLIPLDDEGVSDPFFSFSYNMCEQLSSVKPQTLNPVYY